MTESLLTLIPSCSSIALILVCSFYSPPSCISKMTLPPSSTYLLISWSSAALKGRRGPPSRRRLTSLSLFKVISVLFMSHCKVSENKYGLPCIWFWVWWRFFCSLGWDSAFLFYWCQIEPTHIIMRMRVERDKYNEFFIAIGRRLRLLLAHFQILNY